MSSFTCWNVGRKSTHLSKEVVWEAQKHQQHDGSDGDTFNALIELQFPAKATGWSIFFSGGDDYLKKKFVFRSLFLTRSLLK